jgi:NAD(P)-dependent dehydrogenase (short-subunit alcohol dehydrogenase family)
MQTNHLSHFLLTLGLLPALQRAAQQPPPPGVAAAAAAAGATWRPRTVQVASAMHYFGYALGPADPQMQHHYSAAQAYGNSKLAQVRWWWPCGGGGCALVSRKSTVARVCIC